MRTKISLVVLLGLVLAGAGCVNTVDGHKKAGVPWGTDSVQGNYERPFDQVYQAAKDVIQFKGTLLTESVLHDVPNVVKTLEAKVDQRSVWVRVEAVDSKVTGVVVQARKGGSTDVDLAHELEKEIALKLATR